MVESETANPWPIHRMAIWSLVSLVALALGGPRFVQAFVVSETATVDFYQEWSSAKFFLDGRPVYSKIELALERYQKLRRPPAGTPFNEYNAHPPTTVFIAIPFGHLDYPTATLVWNLLSFALLIAAILSIYRQLRIPFHPCTLLQQIPLLLFYAPLVEQIAYGQLNLLLLWLIVMAWAADRSGRPITAGFFLGTAVAIKFFPAVLFLHFLLRGQWRSLASGAATIVGWTILTAAVLGIGAYRDYFTIVMPHVAEYRLGWHNLSITGFWARLFDGGSKYEKSIPIMYAPWLGNILTAVCDIVVLATVAIVERRAVTREQRDLAFGLCLFAALLISPVTWLHYIVLLFLPLVLIRRALKRESAIRRVLFAVCVAALWIGGGLYWRLVKIDTLHWWYGTAEPWQVLTGISLQFYALLGLFYLGVSSALTSRPAPATVE